MPSAVRTSTLSMAISRIPIYRSFRATKSSGVSARWVTASMDIGKAIASEFRGSATRADVADIAVRTERTCVMRQASPAIRSTADLRPTRWQTRTSASRSLTSMMTFMPRRCFVPGLIGYRSLKMAGAATTLGIYGFGAAAHIVAQIAHHNGQRVFAFTRPGDRVAQDFARSLGCEWAGGSDEAPPSPIDAGIIFAPVGALVPVALKSLVKGGTLVLGGIHMSDIPAFSYDLIWGERVVRSVANLTRQDGVEFMRLAARVPIEVSVKTMPLAQANRLWIACGTEN